jgi:hypothetical protein
MLEGRVVACCSSFVGFTDAMFAILVPLALAPLVLTLLWAERSAKRRGLVDPSLGVGALFLSHPSPSPFFSFRNKPQNHFQYRCIARPYARAVNCVVQATANPLADIPHGE